MRILFLSLVLALPFATVASAQDGADQRTIGLGANVMVDGIGYNGSMLPPVGRVFARWQVRPGIALEPSIGLRASAVRGSTTPVADTNSTYVSAGLGTRLRLAHTDRFGLLLLTRGRIGHDSHSAVEGGPESTSSLLTATAYVGTGIEYAPKRHWAIGVDYEITAFTYSRSRFGEFDPGTNWTVGPRSLARLDAHATVYF